MKTIERKPPLIKYWILTVALVATLISALVFAVVVVEAGRLRRGLLAVRWPVGAYVYDPVTAYALAPAFSERMLDGSFLARTHRLGFRISERDSQSDVTAGGVLSVGCSFTYGDELNAEETFTYRLGTWLNRPSYNYGVCSFSYTTMLLQLDKLEREGVLDQLSPSLIVVGAGSWLEQRSQSPFYPSAVLPLAYHYICMRHARLEIAPPPRFFHAWHGFRYERELFPTGERKWTPSLHNSVLLLTDLAPRALIGRALQVAYFLKYKIGPVSPEDLYEFVVGRLESLASRRHVMLAILWMPMSPDESPPPGLRRAVEGREHVLLVDGSEAVGRAELSTGSYVGRHPSAEAHAVYAEALFRALEIR